MSTLNFLILKYFFICLFILVIIYFLHKSPRPHFLVKNKILNRHIYISALSGFLLSDLGQALGFF